MSTGWENRGEIQRKGRNGMLLARVATLVSSGKRTDKQDGCFTCIKTCKCKKKLDSKEMRGKESRVSRAPHSVK
jgi:hypothetical protein